MDRRHALQVLAVGLTSLTALPAAVRAAAGQDAKPAAAPAKPATPAAAPDGPFSLPPLPYAYEALEPHIDAQTMLIHHDKHHAAYVNNLNKAVTGRAELAGWSLERLLRELTTVPEDIRGVVRNHGGGHHNHTLLWESLKAGGAKAPNGDLAKAIDASFGSFAGCKEKLTAAATSVFGSGWAWLTSDASGKVQVETTPNQDSPLAAGRTPLVGIDVWEHAYYLNYQNRRPDYLEAWWNVVNWDAVAQNFERAVAEAGAPAT